MNAATDTRVLITDRGAWSMDWTGWESNQQNDEEHGQWIATPILKDGREDPTKTRFYSTNGGKIESFMPGEWFDLSIEAGHFRISRNTPTEIKEHEQRRALDALLEALGGRPKEEKSKQ